MLMAHLQSKCFKLKDHLYQRCFFIFKFLIMIVISRNRLVVRTPRCGRGNPGSNPGYGTNLFDLKKNV